MPFFWSNSNLLSMASIRTSDQLAINKARPCNIDTLAHIMAIVVKSVNKVKNGNRYDVPKNHGYRKYMATIIKNTPKISVTMSEKLVNHIGVVQTDGSYFKPTIEKMFESYKLAIPELTISDKLRDALKIQEYKDKENDIDSLKKAIDNKDVQIEAMLNKFELLQKKGII